VTAIQLCADQPLHVHACTCPHSHISGAFASDHAHLARLARRHAAVAEQEQQASQQVPPAISLRFGGKCSEDPDPGLSSSQSRSTMMQKVFPVSVSTRMPEHRVTATVAARSGVSGWPSVRGGVPARWRGLQPLGHSLQGCCEGAGVLAAARGVQQRRRAARLVPLDEQLDGGRVAPPGSERLKALADM